MVVATALGNRGRDRRGSRQNEKIEEKNVAKARVARPQEIPKELNTDDVGEEGKNSGELAEESEASDDSWDVGGGEDGFIQKILGGNRGGVAIGRIANGTHRAVRDKDKEEGDEDVSLDFVFVLCGSDERSNRVMNEEHHNCHPPEIVEVGAGEFDRGRGFGVACGGGWGKGKRRSRWSRSLRSLRRENRHR